jgi:cystathionine beta-lyase
MSDPLNDLSLDDLRARTSVKWRRYAPDVLPLWVAEMDAVLAPAVVDAVDQAVRTGDTGYDFGDSYAEAWSEYAGARWGWDVDVSTARVMPDVMIGITEALRVLGGPGDAVIVTPPVYTPFYTFVRSIDRRVVEAPLTPEGRLDLADEGALERAFRETASERMGPSGAALLLANPHNPSGAAHTRDELARLAALAARYGVRIVSDEIHGPLSGRPGIDDVPPYTPILTVPGAESAVVLTSASKAWNLAGLKAALMVPGPGAVTDVARVPEHASHGVSHVSVIAHVAALREGRAWLEEVLTTLEANRQLLARLLAAHLPALRYRPGHATYLAWLDCRELGLGDDPAATFLDRGRVALNSGPAFGPGGAGHVRLNLATSQEILTEAVRRMASAVAE